MKLNRLIIPNIEGRILMGITMFTSVMMLIGWVAINEPSRMAAFEGQHTARSIERGAELFAANCSECHAADGRGIAGRAPGLNNPQLFGHSFLMDINGQIAPLERQIMDLREQNVELTAERDELFAKAADADEERQTEIFARLAEIDAIIAPEGELTLAEKLAETEAEVLPQLEELYAERDVQITALDGAILKGYYPDLEAKRVEAEEAGDPRIFTNYLEGDASRLYQIDWGGDVASYITTTLVHGRPGSNDVWPAPMVAWSQEAGGPLRRDEIQDIVNYMLNWNKDDHIGEEWDVADLMAVEQFGKIHVDSLLVPADGEGTVQAFGTNVESSLQTIADEGIVGDAARGEKLYSGQEKAQAVPTTLGCSGCHGNGGVLGPNVVGTWSRVQNERLTESKFAGYTVEQYIAESIVMPSSYVVNGYSDGQMPANFGDQLSLQDMADILAYLESQG